MRKNEYILDELGYFDIDTLKRVKEKMDGKSYMDFEIAWSGTGPNCILIIKTQCKFSKKHIKEHFMWCVLNNL